MCLEHGVKQSEYVLIYCPLRGTSQVCTWQVYVTTHCSVPMTATFCVIF